MGERKIIGICKWPLKVMPCTRADRWQRLHDSIISMVIKKIRNNNLGGEERSGHRSASWKGGSTKGSVTLEVR